MMSQPQGKKLANNHIELENSPSESSLSPSHSFSSSHSSSFNSLSNLFATPTLQIRDDKACFEHKATNHQHHHHRRHHHHFHFTRLLHFNDHHGQKLIGSSCFSVLPKPWTRLKSSLGLFSHMASHNHQSSSHHQAPIEFREKRVTVQQREELEQEVSVLHKMLVHEQKVHQYLEQLHHRKDDSSLTIPNYLPPNMRGILAELAMVENEITRLESHIKQLKSETDHGKEVNMEARYNGCGRGTLGNRLESSTLPPHPNKKTDEKVAFETKAMHFINKAIKGEYHLSDFSLNPKSMSSRGFSIHKENTFREGGGGSFREKVIKKSGTIKSSSPMREPRHPTPRGDRPLDAHTDIPRKVLSTPLHSGEESIQRWAPNKLSENIMKCLIFIFVRLLRTSRVMELEKSGPVARSTNFSLSFRAETSSNSKTSLMFQKDSRQQDPYGIFDSEESVLRDIGPYKNLIRFTLSSMDTKCIQNSSSVHLFQRLKLLMDVLQKVDLRFLSHQQKLAFWINMYNACIMHGYLQYGVPSIFTPDNLLALINKATLNIAGNTINAQAIERFILRKPKNKLVDEVLGKDDKDAKEVTVNELYGLESPDPNVIFALCCGTRSSPAVKIYTAEGVTVELEKSKLEYLQAAIMVTGSKRVGIPELLLRNMKEFAADKERLMEWICHQLPTSCSLRKSIFRGVHGAVLVDNMPYQFEFQYLLAV